MVPGVRRGEGGVHSHASEESCRGRLGCLSCCRGNTDSDTPCHHPQAGIIQTVGNRCHCLRGSLRTPVLLSFNSGEVGRVEGAERRGEDKKERRIFFFYLPGRCTVLRHPSARQTDLDVLPALFELCFLCAFSTICV